MGHYDVAIKIMENVLKQLKKEKPQPDDLAIERTRIVLDALRYARSQET